MIKSSYEILGLSKKASKGDIKKAYRKLAQKYHPDRNSGNKVAEERFLEIKEAYSKLMNGGGSNEKTDRGADNTATGDLLDFFNHGIRTK